MVETEGEQIGPDRPVKWLLPVILLVATAMRIGRLGGLPPAMFRDEAEKALNGWFLLNEGVDEQGRPWPLFIKVFGVTTSAIYQYATIPFLAIGGLNEWTARLPAATAGVLTVLFTWLLCRRIWGWKTAAWATGLLAISPWHVPLSRWAQQGVFLPLLFVIGAWAMAGVSQIRIPGSASHTDERRRERNNGSEIISGKWGQWQGTGYLILTALCLALAMYAYDPARLFAPLLGVLAVVIWWHVWVSRWKSVLISAVAFAVAISPVAWLLITHGDEAQARFRYLSVFRPGVSISEGLLTFVGNYFSHFSPGYLLISGDRELRHTAGVGMLNIMEFVLAIMGAWISIRRRCRWGWFMIGWLLLSPVAASLTREGIPHALRSQLALPAWQILAAVGAMAFINRMAVERREMVVKLTALGVMLGAMPFFLSYYGSYAARSAINWQYGVKQSLQFLNNPNTQNSRVTMLESVVGANYLVAFYRQMNRKEFLDMKAGISRYKVLPFMAGANPLREDRQQGAFDTGPLAWVGVPGFGQPEGTSAVPITVPGGEQIGPVMLIYMNNELTRQVTGPSVK